jgi:hypothetical protein
MVREIATDRAATRPVSAVEDDTPQRPKVVNKTGWVQPAPISPPPGIALADRIMDAADERDLHERMMEEAAQRAKR